MNEDLVGLNPAVDLEKVVFTIAGKYYCLVEVPKPEPVLPRWWPEIPASSGEALDTTLLVSTSEPPLSDSIPPVHVLRKRLAELMREQDYLRSLLRVAERKEKTEELVRQNERANRNS